MSDGIRQAAAPTHTRLQRTLANLPILQQPAPGAPQREVQHQLQNSLAAHQYALQQLQEAITLLSKREDQWLELLQRTDIDCERELELFRKSQTDEFLYTLELARERAVTISANIQQIEQTLRELSSVPSLTNPTPTNPAASTVHLPKMDLKTFDGRLQDWPAFWNWYQSAIDSQPIPELQKLMYLKSCLKGSAATLIGAYALRTHAYTTVVDALKKRYERPEAIVNALYDELDHLPRAREGQLAQLTENIDRILELLAHQGEPTNTRPIQRTIERKLPKRVLEKLEQAKAATREWTVDLMRENLAAMVIADENIARALPHDPISERTKRTKEDVNLNLGTSALMNLNVGEKRHFPPEKRKSNGERTCPFCNRCGHKPHECRTLSTPESRIAAVVKEKLCFLCLRHGHQASACKGRSCFKCSRKHHPALCSYKPIRSQPDPKEAVIIKSHVAADLAPPSEPKVQTLATTATFASSQQARDVGEQALREIQSDLGHTGESLAASIEDVVSHWRLCLTLAVMAVLGIVTTAICFYCEGARLMCCILARRVRRRKEERRKSKASVPRKADVARAKTFEAASDKGRLDEAHNGEGKQRTVSFVPLQPSNWRRGECRESEESIDDESVDFRRQAGAARSIYSSQLMNRPVSITTECSEKKIFVSDRDCKGIDIFMPFRGKVQRKEDLCFRS